MLVQNVKQGMILRSDGRTIIQALTDAQTTARNGSPDSFCEFEAVDLISQERISIGAAHPPQAYAPSLELVGWACKLG